VKSRPWSGYEDLRAMQDLALESRRLLGARAPWHVGDIAWGFRQHAGREHEWRIRLWEDDGSVVAWSWLRTDTGALDHDVHPHHLGLLDELLDEPDAREASMLGDDEEKLAAFARHGFIEPSETMQMNALHPSRRLCRKGSATGPSNPKTSLNGSQCIAMSGRRRA